MSSFLADIASELLSKGGNDFSQTCIVLPNRRAGVFLRNAISKLSKDAIWAPRIISIEDFVFELSSIAKADQTTLLFAFFEVYSQKAKDPQTMELFANWAPVFLSDVNELDLNLIDAEDIFAQLYSIERIKKWNPETGEPTDFQSRHLQFVEQFYPFYTELRSQLQKGGVGYQGMAFREVAENIEKIIAASEWNEVWFAGFNALTVSEERILQRWNLSGKARLFWDMDEYYASDMLHEAGHYWRKFSNGSSELKVDKAATWVGNNLGSYEKHLAVIGAQRSISQAKVAGTILARKLEEGNTELTNMAVVLNDEQLLLPLLSSLPTEMDGVNITMGYGLKHSQSAVFVETLFKLYANGAELAEQFYHEDVAELENDPFFKLVQKDASQDERPKKVYLSFDDLQLSDLHQTIFHRGWLTVSGFLDELKQLVSVLGTRLHEDSIEREFLVLIDKLAQRLSDLTTKYEVVTSIKTLHTFWRQLVRSQQLDFVGEPLSGLQVMGMLETRNLDFEEVIMLGVNEGKLPSTAHSPSYFTFDIRRAYGLPCQNERDAVTAYHFYRLLQRAQKVTLVYDEDTDGFGGGEVSRYVKQLLLESGANINIEQKSVEQVIPNSVLPPAISFQKTTEVMETLAKRASAGFSPSALNTFRSCSLKYYFKYIARIEEPDPFEENINSAKLGTAIHDTLEELYLPFVGRALVESELTERKKLVAEKLQFHFKEQLKTREDLTGEDLLAFEVAKVYVQRVIKRDIEQLKSGNVITIVGLEKELLRDVMVTFGEKKFTVRLKGLADRIDRLSDGTVRVIDYKTGSFRKRFEIKSKDDFERSDTDNAFQMLTYLYAFAPELSAEKMTATGFYLRSKDIEKPITVAIEKQQLYGQQLLDFYEEALMELVTSLFDDSAAFEQTEDVKRCEYCDFREVCQR